MPAIEHGKLITIAPDVYRITAPNPGPMTGQGTNTYLFGKEHIAVIDPGPALEEHVQAILAGVAKIGGSISHIIVTHTHSDHSPAAKLLQQHCGAPLVGEQAPDTTFQDETFVADITCSHEQIFAADNYRLRMLHTPGHVGNHYCIYDEVSQLLVAGDHIMNGSTVVIVPPSGDMGAYIRSLALLKHYDISYIAPAHGDVMPDAIAEIDGLIQHRLTREAKVVSKMKGQPAKAIEELVVDVYDDVDSSLHRIAYFSLWAHLLKLAEDGVAAEQDNKWQLVN